MLGSGPTLRLRSVEPEDAGDYVCRAEPRLSDLGGGAAEARLTVNGEKARLPGRGQRGRGLMGVGVASRGTLRTAGSGEGVRTLLRGATWLAGVSGEAQGLAPLDREQGWGRRGLSSDWSPISIPAPPVVTALHSAPAFLRGPARLQCLIFASPAPEAVVRKCLPPTMTHQP